MDHGTERLVSVLNTVKNKINRLHQKGDHFSEQDTKGTLIEPVFAALGWDLGDVEEVRREYKHKRSDNPVDYSLMKDGKPVLFLEAKAAHINLDDRKWLKQVVNYANTAGVQWCVLTNGDHYRIFNAHAPVVVEEKLLCEFKVKDDFDKPYVFKVLSMLQQSELGSNALTNMWDSNYSDKLIQQLIESFLDTPDDSFIRLIKKRLPELTPKQISNSTRRLWAQFQKISSSVEPSVPTVKPHTESKTTSKKTPTGHNVTLKEIAAAGLIDLPLAIEKTYKKRRLTAVIQSSGEIEFEGKLHDSPSAAGGYARNSILGSPTDGHKYWPTNGWSFWHYHDRTIGKLVPIDRLRQAYIDMRSAKSGLRVV